jgi:hypothetical protein
MAMSQNDSTRIGCSNQKNLKIEVIEIYEKGIPTKDFDRRVARQLHIKILETN